MEYYRKAGEGDGTNVRQEMLNYVDLDVMEGQLITMKDKGMRRKESHYFAVSGTQWKLKRLSRTTMLVIDQGCEDEK